MPSISPGLVQGCFELLILAARQRLTFAEIKASFAYLGGVASRSVVEAAQALNWIQVDENGCASLTPSGTRLISLESYERQLRQALLDYIDIERPSWLQNASFGRSRVLMFSGGHIAQVFIEAGLADSTADEVVAFWDTLSARARGQRSEHLNRVGRKGEKLTLDYEYMRTGKMPTWVAIENNADGYDVLSIIDREDPRKLTIEVKSSVLGSGGQIFLTRNEWDRATAVDNHLFHLWDISDYKSPKLAVVSVHTMIEHIPIDQGMGAWESVAIPYSSFKKLFS